MPRLLLPLLALAIAAQPAALLARAIAQEHAVVAMQQSDGDDDDKKTPVRSHNAGVIDGQVVAVDYRAGTITVKTADRGRVDVQILPSTIIQGPNASFRAITDIAKGTHVQVFASQRGNAYSAQIVHLK